MDKKQNELVYILESNKNEEASEETLCSSAVVVNLYYEDALEFYMEYINKIPLKIDVYVISSKEVIIQKLKNNESIRKDIHLIRKKNRGRDISALLVSAKSILNQYQYICFVHDKKGKEEYSKEDALNWNLNLWENSIGTEGYIQNLLLKFEQNPNLGMMVPPKPNGKYLGLYGELLWAGDYKNTVKLAKKLSLECIIERSIPPLTIGTVFWARTKALKKLFEIEWEYESFPDEPMSDDGEINHAIERILGYVVRDAGFDVAVAMINTYVEKVTDE